MVGLRQIWHFVLGKSLAALQSPLKAYFKIPGGASARLKSMAGSEMEVVPLPETAG